MANEVQITITGDDTSGPAFASAMAKMLALKALAEDTGDALGNITLGGVNAGDLTTSLMLLKNKMQSLGIADIADINVQPGVLMSRLEYLKRLIQQSGISDLMDINVGQSSLDSAAAKLGNLSSLASLPIAGPTENYNMGVGMTPEEIAAVNGSLRTFTGDAAQAATASVLLNSAMKDTGKSVSDTALYVSALSNVVKQNNGLLAGAFTLWGAAGAFFGKDAVQAQTFGGALAGIPLLGTVTAGHLLIDWAVEFAAVLIPATLAVIAFGVAAAPVIGDMYTHLSNLYTITVAFGQSIYPFSGKFATLANAVRPEVYQAFGDALVVLNANTGKFQSLAVSTGSVLDELAARFTVAMTSGAGFSSFMSKAVEDVQGLGNVIFNIAGTIGNLLKTMPGYAQIILQVWQGVTGALETVTASPITQWIVKAGLYVHGFAVYVGLATTAALLLGDALLGLAGRVGLVDTGLTLFNGEMFAAGLKQMAGGVALLGSGLLGMSSAEDIATGSTMALGGAMDMLAAAGPVIAIAAVAAAITGLVMVINNAHSATKSAISSMQGALGSMSINALGPAILTQQATAASNLATAQKQLNTAQAANTVIVAAHAGAYNTDEQAVGKANDAINLNSGLIKTASTDTSNYNTLLKAAGGNLGLFAEAGITASDVVGAGTQQLKQYEVELKATADEMKALSLGTGQYAAAQNAMSNLNMTEMLPSLQAINTAQDNLINYVLAAPQAMTTFEQAIQQMGSDANMTAAQITALAGGSQTMANDFYNSAVPAAQKLIDSFTDDRLSSSQMSGALADITKQLVPFSSGVTGSQQVMVDLINNALGPGTVSLQSLNSWIQQNATSTSAWNGLLATAITNASNLSGVLNAQVAAALSAATLASSGFDDSLTTLQRDMMNGSPAATVQTDAQNVYDSLIHSGVGATQAKQDVDEYFQQLGKIPPAINTNITVSGLGSDASQVSNFLSWVRGQSATLAVNEVIVGPSIGGGAHIMTASGGISVAHRAVGGPSGNLTMVGENGPELVRLPSGATVFPHSTSDAMSGWGAGGGPGPLEIVVSYDQTAVMGLGQGLLKDLKYTIRTKGGGNVQKALGWGE